LKPLQLTLQAFGPYADKEFIDFTKLENRTMFVISGKTGAGKTTIFDGITFAIFGKASGEDRNGTDLRSHFASEDLFTEVSLLFSFREKRYLVIRSPQQEKKKERGEGYTTINAKAELYEVKNNGEKEIIASNVREVDEKIKEIIQLDANQFRQILMIPQGEFRKLLVSDSKDKEVILQRLFHTSTYKKIEEKLKEESTVLKKMVEDEQRRRTSLFDQITVYHLSELKQLLTSEDRNETLMMELTKKEIDVMKKQRDEIEEQLKEIFHKKNETYSHYVEAKNTLEQLSKLNVLKQKMNELEELKDQLRHKEIEVENAKKASRLEHQENLCQRLKENLNHLEEKIKKLNEELTRIKVLVAEKERIVKEEEEKEPLRKKAAEKIQQLENMKEDIYSFDTIFEQWDSLKKQLDKLLLQEKQAEEEYKQLEEQIIKAKGEKSLLEGAKVKVLETQSKLEKVNEQLLQINQLQLLQDELNGLSHQLEEKKRLVEKVEHSLNDSKQLYLSLDRQWRENQAHLLSETLKDGEPCPVCGSTHHPKRAEPTDKVPTLEQLDAAKADTEQWEAEKRKIEKDYYSLQLNYDHKIEKRNELLTSFRKSSVTELEEIKLNLDKEHRVFSQIIEEETEKDKEFQRISNWLNQAEEQKNKKFVHIQSLNEEKRRIENQYIEKNVRVQQLIAKIPTNLRNKDVFNDELQIAIKTFDELMKKLEESKEQLQVVKEKHSVLQGQLKQSIDVKTEQQAELENERNIFKEMLEKEGFVNYQSYSLAKKTEIEIQEITEWIRNFRETYRSTKDQYDQLQAILKDVEIPNVEDLEQQLTNLDQVIERLQNDFSTCTMTITKNEELLHNIEQINETIKDMEERYRLVGHLSDIARGQNAQKMTFERYVLASFLEEILQVANIRLSKMTNGRYQLIRRKDRSKGNVQSGLELHVYDQYTGQERHVKTLSGGESFKASLALALGLSDVVQQYAGGISLETMFIDEGFGTLDPESLDSAIESLIEIQNSGRLVGIISHVPELKERIGAHLEVIATQRGSETKFVFMS